MPGAMRKMAVYLGLVEDEPLDGYDDDYVEEEQPKSRGRRGFAQSYVPEQEDRYSSTVRPISEPRSVRTLRSEETRTVNERRPMMDLSRIETIHPRSYNDARRIGEDFRDGIPVIMNLGEMDDNDAKRIIDFAAGLVFGLRGSIERITNKVFLLSPVNVDVGDQAREQVREDGFFNQS